MLIDYTLLDYYPYEIYCIFLFFRISPFRKNDSRNQNLPISLFFENLYQTLNSGLGLWIFVNENPNISIFVIFFFILFLQNKYNPKSKFIRYKKGKLQKQSLSIKVGNLLLHSFFRMNIFRFLEIFERNVLILIFFFFVKLFLLFLL